MLLEPPDLGSLLTRQYLGTDIVDAERTAHCFGGQSAIPGEQHDADTELVERRNGNLRRWSNPVGDGDETKHPAIRRYVKDLASARSLSASRSRSGVTPLCSSSF